MCRVPDTAAELGTGMPPATGAFNCAIRAPDSRAARVAATWRAHFRYAPLGRKSNPGISHFGVIRDWADAQAGNTRTTASRMLAFGRRIWERLLEILMVDRQSVRRLWAFSQTPGGQGPTR